MIRSAVKTAGLVFGAAVASQAAYGEVVYQVSPGTQAQSRFSQQAGNNRYAIGDDANIGAAGMQLDTVKMQFAVFTYDFGYGTGTYAPSIELQIYAIDPITKLPVDEDLVTAGIQASPIASAPQNNAGSQTLTGSNSPGGNFTEIFTDGSFQEFTFDFTSQNFILPAEFGFAYHDTTGGAGISSGLAVLASTVGPTTGTSNSTIFISSPNDPNSDAFVSNASRFLVSTIEAHAIPEPASVLLLGAGSLLALRRRQSRA